MKNKDIAISFLDLVSSGDVHKAFEKFIHPNFCHHNAYFKGDRESLLQAMEENAQKFPNKKYDTVRALEEGDLAAVHGKVKLSADSQWSVIHIFRFENNKIVELWEASQEVLENSPNEYGLF